MAKVVVVTSGKGEWGRRRRRLTSGPPQRTNGEKVVVVDFDVGLRNLDLVMGSERRGGGST